MLYAAAAIEALAAPGPLLPVPLASSTIEWRTGGGTRPPENGFVGGDWGDGDGEKEVCGNRRASADRGVGVSGP